MKKTIACIFSITILAFFISCTGPIEKEPKLVKSESDFKTENTAFGWYVKDAAISKLVKIGPDVLIGLGEQYSKFSSRYSIYIFEKGKTPLKFSGLDSSSEIMDISQGPEVNSFFVSFVDQQDLKKKIHIAYYSYSCGGFNNHDHIARKTPEFPELEQNNTEDISDSRITIANLSFNNKELSVISRNLKGTLYVQRFSLKRHNSLLTDGEFFPLSLSSNWLVVAPTGGSSDVMGEIASYSNIISLHSNDGTLYVIVPFLGEDIEGNKQVGIKHFLNAFKGSAKDEPFYMHLAFKIKGNQVVVKKMFFDHNLHNYSDIFAQSAFVKDEKLYIAGLKRNMDKEGRSEVFIQEEDKAPIIFNSNHGSASAQSILFDDKGVLYVGGSWDWWQNPNGISIGGGNAYFSKIDINNRGLWVGENYIKGKNSRRSEVRASIYVDGMICLGGMDSGPDTHAADKNEANFFADGFVNCFKN